MRSGRSLSCWGTFAPVLLGVLALSGCMRSPEQKSAAYVEAGKRLLEKKDQTRAILQFKNAAQATPQNAEVFYRMGLAYLAVSDYRQGVGALRKALELNPRHVAAQLRLAQLMATVANKDVLKDAQKRLQGVLQDAPDNPDALHALALTEFKLGDTGDAMEHLQHAATAAPQQLMIALTLAQAKLLQKDAREAEEVLKKFSDGSPKAAGAHTALADFYIFQKRMPEAEVQLHQALEIDPKSGEALVMLARLQLLDDRKEEAEENFRKAATFEGYESTYAIFLDQMGRREEGLREFERVAKAHPADREVRTNLVVAYQHANRLEDAKKTLGDALKKNPNDLDALLQRGELYMRSGNYPQAETDLNRVVKLKPAAPEVHYILGRLNRARGKPLIYRQELAEALKLDPYLLPVRLEAAQDLISGNSAKAALDLLDQAPEFQKSSVAFLIERNWCLLGMGKDAELRKGIDQGMAITRSADFLIQDGLWKLRAGNIAGAQAAIEEALKIDPENVRALRSLYGTYTASKTESAGLEKVREYASRMPKSAAAQQLLGILLLLKGQRGEARKAFDLAKAADPHSTSAELSLVQLDVAERKWDSAQARLKAVLASGPNSTAYLWLGIVDQSTGRGEAAIEDLRNAVAADAQNAQALNNLAYVLAENGKNLDEALGFSQKACELAPTKPDFSDTLGWILYRKGLYDAAVTQLGNATSLNKKTDPLIQYHLAMAYAKTGQVSRGRTTLDAALKLNPNLPEAKMATDVLAAAK